MTSPLIHNASYIESLRSIYASAPETLPEEWQAYFSSFQEAPSFSNTSFEKDQSSSIKEIDDSLKIASLIHNYRTRGHLYAHLDPLGLTPPCVHPDLEIKTLGFHEGDYDRSFYVGGSLGLTHATLRHILHTLQKIYCGTLGIEFIHIQDPKRREWMQDAFETIPFSLTPDQEREALYHLVRAERFENFLHKKFQGAKRFGLDGGESLIPGLEFLLLQLSSQGVDHLVMGMAHRGRLNVITNVLQQSYRKLFTKFLNTKEDPHALGSGDVKYHQGYSCDREILGRTLHLSLMANPSHLEAVDPVVLGKVRCEQYHAKDYDRKRIAGLLMHGDAAFAGQGLVAETLELSDLAGYRTGGTFHVIINNQIGFTTSPPQSRSSPYCSDVAKVIQAPIFHVNSDDPMAVLRAFHLASLYRERFQSDVVIDLICYRRYGHNESDEPSFTQPLMYKTIAAHATTATLYGKSLIEKGALSSKDLEHLHTDVQNHLESEYQEATQGDACFDPPLWLQGAWKSIKPSTEGDDASFLQPSTGVDGVTLRSLGARLFQTPQDFNVNSKIKRQLDAKQKMLQDGENIDWGTAEALAFASLLSEGHHVRLSGQDCGRGTFSHRHAVLIDQDNEQKYIPLDHVSPQQPAFEIVDSPLAEASVLGFEYGYSSAHPNNLVMWEAQFGDFSNGAQVIIDQFLSSGEMKWSRQNGLVLLLPHGFEGQGPEHSSARLERFLQLCAEGNWSVANCSTPSNYFHILRRQLKQNYRKPLILMTPKSLLRHKQCLSILQDFEGAFQPVIAPLVPSNPTTVTRVVLCSGRIFYDLLAASKDYPHVMLMRLEQYYPFPRDALRKALQPYSHAQVVWCQEEPENMGAWHFLDRRLEELLLSLKMHFSRPFVVARSPAASPATGRLHQHEKELKHLIKAVFAMQSFRDG